jgi:hypothetical protein
LRVASLERAADFLMDCQVWEIADNGEMVGT